MRIRQFGRVPKTHSRPPSRRLAPMASFPSIATAAWLLMPAARKQTPHRPRKHSTWSPRPPQARAVGTPTVPMVVHIERHAARADDDDRRAETLGYSTERAADAPVAGR